MTDEKRDDDTAAADTPLPPPLRQLPLIDFDEVAGDNTTVLIRFQDAVYTLKRTRNNRLVLHK